MWRGDLSQAGDGGRLSVERQRLVRDRFQGWQQGPKRRPQPENKLRARQPVRKIRRVQRRVPASASAVQRARPKQRLRPTVRPPARRARGADKDQALFHYRPADLGAAWRSPPGCGADRRHHGSVAAPAAGGDPPRTLLGFDIPGAGAILTLLIIMTPACWPPTSSASGWCAGGNICWRAFRSSIRSTTASSRFPTPFSRRPATLFARRC
jgi:hypothetical protein